MFCERLVKECEATKDDIILFSTSVHYVSSFHGSQEQWRSSDDFSLLPLFLDAIISSDLCVEIHCPFYGDSYAVSL